MKSVRFIGGRFDFVCFVDQSPKMDSAAVARPERSKRPVTFRPRLGWTCGLGRRGGGGRGAGEGPAIVSASGVLPKKANKLDSQVAIAFVSVTAAGCWMVKWTAKSDRNWRFRKCMLSIFDECEVKACLKISLERSQIYSQAQFAQECPCQK